MALVKVNGTGFIRDTKSMGLINTDVAAKNDYMMKSRLLNNQKQELNNMREEMAVLKDDVLEIKQLLKRFVEISG